MLLLLYYSLVANSSAPVAAGTFKFERDQQLSTCIVSSLSCLERLLKENIRALQNRLLCHEQLEIWQLHPTQAAKQVECIVCKCM